MQTKHNKTRKNLWCEPHNVKKLPYIQGQTVQCHSCTSYSSSIFPNSQTTTDTTKIWKIICLNRSGLIKLVKGVIPPFSRSTPFLEIHDVPTFYRPIRKTKVLKESFNQLLFKFFQESVLILEEYLLQWWNANLI